MFKSKNKKAQSVVEVGILLGIVVMALMAMQVYIKRGIQGKIAHTVDERLGNEVEYTPHSSQFEPDYYSSEGNSASDSNTTVDAMNEYGNVTITSNEAYNRTDANESIGAWGNP